MKRKVLVLWVLVMLLSMTGCGKGGGETTDPDTAPPEERSVEEQNNGEAETARYADDQALFIGWDKYNIEGDRDTPYCYNYKGELLDSDAVRYYAENGLAAAYDPQTGHVGYIDRDGVFVIEPKYYDAAPFSKDGLALVKVRNIIDEEEYKYEDKCGYINSKGEEITPLIYDYATSFFNCGYALAYVTREVTDEEGYTSNEPWKQYIIDKNGNTVTEVDLTATELPIAAVCENYYVCKNDEELVIFDYANKELLRTALSQTDSQRISYFCEKDNLHRNIYYYEGDTFIGREFAVFNGKEFIRINDPYEGVTKKHVATTQSGDGYGVEKNGETVIPFIYDDIWFYGDYYVAIKQVGEDYYDQVFDIYDKNYQKTAENIEYAFESGRNASYGAKESLLPNGYFEIFAANDDYGRVYGIVDYTGKIIVEPVFGRGITLYAYEEAGNFEWWWSE